MFELKGTQGVVGPFGLAVHYPGAGAQGQLEAEGAARPAASATWPAAGSEVVIVTWRSLTRGTLGCWSLRSPVTGEGTAAGEVFQSACSLAAGFAAPGRGRKPRSDLVLSLLRTALLRLQV